MVRYLTIVAFGLAMLVGMAAVAAEKCDLPLVFEDDFEKGADRWQPTDAAAWRIVETDRGKVYNQFKNSDYKPPHRSPLNISLVKDVTVGDFVLTAKVQSTCREYPHRDMCLFFGYQDPAHFYYVHLGKRADPHANQIMIVNDAPRVMITEKESPGTPWDDGWHEVKIVRRTADGAIEVYFDDMEKPMLAAKDKTFTWGRVGLGSFDDTGNWDDFKLCGKKVEKK
ncbi:MAG TPA: hypothetical protein VMY37_39940 [Thermoguttaceae bacterium]|nr:hypothetical protein [Thermoguttaceae bacterium]